MEVDVKPKTVISVTMSLSVEEATALQSMMQNPVCEDEPVVITDIRSGLFNSLTSALKLSKPGSDNVTKW